VSGTPDSSVCRAGTTLVNYRAPRAV
jgi:hypothetical protein